MGFIEDKNSIVEQLNLFEVFGDLPKNKKISNIKSVRDKSKNLTPFLLDLLSIGCTEQKRNSSVNQRAKCDLIRILTEVLVDFFPVFIRILKEGLIKGFKAGFVCPADFKMPNIPPIILTQKQFDPNKMVSLDPNTFPNNLFFGDENKDLNTFITNLVGFGVGSSNSWKDFFDFEIVDQNNDLALKVGINQNYVGKEFDVFLKDYFNSIQLFDFDNFIPNLMEQFNGSISSLSPDSTINDIEKAIDKEKVDAMVEKLLDIDPCESTFVLDDSFFEFDGDELLRIEKNAQNRLRGVKVVDFSCVPTLIGSDNLFFEDEINELKEITKQNPNGAKLVVQQYTETILTRLSENSVDSDDVKKSISFDLTLSIPKLVASLIFSPKIMIPFQVAKKIITNGISNENNTYDFARANKVFFEYVIRESLSALLKVLFDKIKQIILRKVVELVVALIKEAIDKKLKQLKSLTGRFDVTSGLSQLGNNVVDDLTSRASF
jgi:hypothetical protein